ncbi:MAG: hypothetical protein K0B15_12260 [Lentimicrobium sp.]|nr:hypothetical protein [Lentimicrobium sp.]
MQETEAILTESKAVDTLLNEGAIFTVEARGLLRLFGKKSIRIHIKQPYLGTLLLISKEYLKIHLDETKLAESAYQNSYMLVPENAKRIALIVSYAILNNRLKIKLFSTLLAKWLMWRINPGKLFKVMTIVVMISNVASFTNSIRLIQAFRMMKPKEESLSRDSTGV